MTVYRAITNHIKTSLTTVLPTKSFVHESLERYPVNPFPSLTRLSILQWQLFFLGLWVWILDAASFFSVSLTSHYLVDQFDKSIVDINDGIMYSLFTRVLGALIFGFFNDMFSRKWTYVVVCSLLCVIQLGTSFVQTYNQFIACRCIFGIILGASFSVGNITATENINGRKTKNSKDDIAGILSGIFQTGYPIGYLIAQGAVRGLVENTNSKHTWRILYWFTSALCVPFIVWRILLPESPIFLEKKALHELHMSKHSSSTNKTKLFIANFKKAVTTYWDKIVYQCAVMGAISFITHGSQDLFPTLLRSLGFSSSEQSNINIVANCGSIVGCLFASHIANYIGIRFTMMIGSVIGCCILYPWGYVKSGKMASAFFVQFAVQFGICNVPKYLHELSSYGDMKYYSTIIMGLAYQFGTLVSAPSSTIQSKLATSHNDDYGSVMTIFLAIAFVSLFIIVLFGIENRDCESMVTNFEDESLQVFDIQDEQKDEETGSVDSSSIKKPQMQTEHIENC